MEKMQVKNRLSRAIPIVSGNCRYPLGNFSFDRSHISYRLPCVSNKCCLNTFFEFQNVGVFWLSAINACMPFGLHVSKCRPWSEAERGEVGVEAALELFILLAGE